MMKKLRNIKPGRDGIWQVLRHLKKTTVSEIHGITGVNKRTTLSYLRQLAAGGYVVMTEGDHHNDPIIFELVKDGGYHRPVLDNDGKPREPSSNQRMWMAIKVFGQPFSVLDLSLASAVNERTVTAYVTALCRAKFVKQHRPGRVHQRALYLYIRSNDTGPKAPMIRRDKSVYDQNTHQVVWRPEVAA